MDKNVWFVIRGVVDLDHIAATESGQRGLSLGFKKDAEGIRNHVMVTAHMGGHACGNTTTHAYARHVRFLEQDNICPYTPCQIPRASAETCEVKFAAR
jgi:hypothetical protein